MPSRLRCPPSRSVSGGACSVRKGRLALATLFLLMLRWCCCHLPLSLAPAGRWRALALPAKGAPDGARRRGGAVMRAAACFADMRAPLPSWARASSSPHTQRQSIEAVYAASAACCGACPCRRVSAEAVNRGGEAFGGLRGWTDGACVALCLLAALGLLLWPPSPQLDGAPNGSCSMRTLPLRGHLGVA